MKTRTIVNQAKFLIRLIKELYDFEPQMGFVIDGFSMPVKLTKFRESDFRSWISRSIIRSEHELVEDIRNSIPSDANLYCIVGNSLQESIIWANNVDMYFCHYGTLQHKVGWLAKKPGIVHGNSIVLKQPAAHIVNGCEDTIPPVYINPSDVKNYDNFERRKGWKTQGNLQNYKFKNENHVIDQVIQFADNIRSNK